MELVVSTGLYALMGLLFGLQFARYTHMEILRKEKVITKTPPGYWVSYLVTLTLIFIIVYLETGINGKPSLENGFLEAIRFFLAILIPIYFGYRWQKARIEKAYNKRLQIDATPPRD